MKKVLTIIQARMTSSRLPGKVMLPLAGEPLLVRMVKRVQEAKGVGRVIVATTNDTEDDVLADLCFTNKIEFFRGDRDDLLDRHYQAAKKYQADIILKIPSDCPLIDPTVIDRVISFFEDDEHDLDYASNLHPASYPDGNDVEVMSIKALERAWLSASRKFEREHTTPYIWENPDRFKIGNVVWEKGLDYSMSHRWTIDYPEDYTFIKIVFETLYPVKKIFSMEDILNLLETKPGLMSINDRYAGVNWYRNHIGDLRTITKNQTRMLQGN